jgi:hypothetical protein
MAKLAFLLEELVQTPVGIRQGEGLHVQAARQGIDAAPLRIIELLYRDSNL